MTDLRDTIKNRLDQLSGENLTLFAASRAQRLLPWWDKYAAAVHGPGADQDHLMRRSVQLIWDSHGLIDARVRRLLEAVRPEILAQLPGDDDAIKHGAGYAGSAGSVVLYAIDTALSGSREKGRFSANACRNVYYDIALRDMLPDPVGTVDSKSVMASPLVHAELQEQCDELELLANLEFGEGSRDEVVSSLRENSQEGERRMRDLIDARFS